MTISRLKILTTAAIIAVGVLFALSGNSYAQGLRCGNRAKMVKTLDRHFKEARFAMGLASNVNLFEIFISKRGTWTILSTRTNGVACIVAAGKSWVNMPAKLPGDAVNY